ncbi:MAG: substrate-binding domain-containing protein [Marinibacterium sp.]|nr:substrate-binding domain-containing protein [Marinibacterium sp.]
MSQGDDIATGRPRRVTAQMVADAAGVSRSAVSRAFTPGAYLDDGKRRRIRDVAARIGYQPNALAAGLKGGRSHLVAIFVGDMRSPQDTEFVSLLVRELNDRGKWPILIDGGGDRALEAFDDVMRYPLDALIVRGGSMPAAIAAQSAKFGVPVISSGRVMDGPGIDSVCCRNGDGARTGADVLIARGRRRFGFLNGPADYSSSQERRAGLLSALDAGGLPLVAERACDFTVDGGHAAALDLLGRGDRIDALVCANDASAIGALAAAADLGIDVPGALSIVGFDDIGMAGWRMFNLSTVRNPNVASVAEILRLLERRLEDPARPAETICIAPQFVPRGTH